MEFAQFNVSFWEPSDTKVGTKLQDVFSRAKESSLIIESICRLCLFTFVNFYLGTFIIDHFALLSVFMILFLVGVFYTLILISYNR